MVLAYSILEKALEFGRSACHSDSAGHLLGQIIWTWRHTNAIRSYVAADSTSLSDSVATDIG